MKHYLILCLLFMASLAAALDNPVYTEPVYVEPALPPCVDFDLGFGTEASAVLAQISGNWLLNSYMSLGMGFQTASFDQEKFDFSPDSFGTYNGMKFSLATRSSWPVAPYLGVSYFLGGYVVPNEHDSCDSSSDQGSGDFGDILWLAIVFLFSSDHVGLLTPEIGLRFDVGDSLGTSRYQMVLCVRHHMVSKGDEYDFNSYCIGMSIGLW